MSKLNLLLVAVLTGSSLFGQIRTYHEEDYRPMADSLRKEWGQNKLDIPTHYELPILLALTYYPELKETQIRFKETKIKTSMNAQPTVASILFRKKDKWRFVVRINNLQKDSMVLVSKVPFNALVGVFGHEFYHFMDYKTKKPGHFLGFLFKYMNKKGKKEVEYYTDLGTIKRGLGWQCYDFERYVQEESNASVAYKKFKAETYLSAEQILEEMKKLELYKEQ